MYDGFVWYGDEKMCFGEVVVEVVCVLVLDNIVWCIGMENWLIV